METAIDAEHGDPDNGWLRWLLLIDLDGVTHVYRRTNSDSDDKLGYAITLVGQCLRSS